MNDKDRADALVDAGILERHRRVTGVFVYRLAGTTQFHTHEYCLTDGRVAMKCLERLMQPGEPVFAMQNMCEGKRGRFIVIGKLPSPVCSIHEHTVIELKDEDLSRAIIDAYLEARK